MDNHTGPTRRAARYGMAEGGPIQSSVSSTGNHWDDEPARDRSGIEAAYEHAVEQLTHASELLAKLTDRLRPVLTDGPVGAEIVAERPGGASPHAEALYSIARRGEAIRDQLAELLQRLDV